MFNSPQLTGDVSLFGELDENDYLRSSIFFFIIDELFVCDTIKVVFFVTFRNLSWERLMSLVLFYSIFINRTSFQISASVGAEEL